jgi:hypothetical protein
MPASANVWGGQFFVSSGRMLLRKITKRVHKLWISGESFFRQFDNMLS